MFRMENWKIDMLFQKKKCLFFIATEVVPVWWLQGNLCAEGTKHDRS